ncbi:excinuclease ABC subunit A, partial [Streptomyces sp. NPDC058953]
ISVLSGLVDKGNTVIVIEHNLDVIKTADWVVDMGPEGGSGGGLVVAEGTPEEVAGVPASHTGKFLRDILDPERVSDAAVPRARTAPRKRAAKKTAARARKA